MKKLRLGQVRLAEGRKTALNDGKRGDGERRQGNVTTSEETSGETSGGTSGNLFLLVNIVRQLFLHLLYRHAALPTQRHHTLSDTQLFRQCFAQSKEIVLHIVFLDIHFFLLKIISFISVFLFNLLLLLQSIDIYSLLAYMYSL